MRQMMLRLFTVIGVMLLAAAPVDPAWAQSSRDLKNTGMVGETVNGYLGVVDAGAGADLKAQVEELNGQRRASYQDTAGKTGQSLGDVELVAGARLREMAESGDWIQDAAGRWIQKP
jgi:hypothetical protein